MKRNRRNIFKRSIALLLVATMVLKTNYTVFAWRGYPSAEPMTGSNNTSEKLFRWVRLEHDKQTPRELLGLSEDEDVDLRMMIGYYEDGDWYYYRADVSNVLKQNNNGWCYGLSMTSTTDSTDVKLGAQSFVTRGGHQAFHIVERGAWSTSDSDYDGDYRYELFGCQPGSDEKEDAQVWFVEGIWGSKNWFYYDSSGQPVGGERSNNHWSDSDYYKNSYKGSKRSYWAIDGAKGENINGSPAFCFTAYDNSTYNDPHLTHTSHWDIRAFSCEKCGWTADQALWVIYFGCETDIDLNGNTEEVTYDFVDAITSPYIIRKDQEYVIETNGVLFVNDILVLRGKLTNKGLLIVGNDGCIIEMDDGDSTQTISNEGGDIIVKSGAYIGVDQFISKKSGDRCPQIVNYGYINPTHYLELSDTIVDNRGEICGGFIVNSDVLGLEKVRVSAGKSYYRAKLIDSFRLTGALKTACNDYSYNQGTGNKLIQDQTAVFSPTYQLGN